VRHGRRRPGHDRRAHGAGAAQPAGRCGHRPGRRRADGPALRPPRWGHDGSRTRDRPPQRAGRADDRAAGERAGARVRGARDRRAGAAPRHRAQPLRPGGQAALVSGRDRPGPRDTPAAYPAARRRRRVPPLSAARRRGARPRLRRPGQPGGRGGRGGGRPRHPARGAPPRDGDGGGQRGPRGGCARGACSQQPWAPRAWS